MWQVPHMGITRFDNNAPSIILNTLAVKPYFMDTAQIRIKRATRDRMKVRAAKERKTILEIVEDMYAAFTSKK